MIVVKTLLAETDDGQIDINNILCGIKSLMKVSHQNNIDAGWWNDKETGESLLEKPDVPRALCLMHSEISEALEAYRRNLPDSHLPHRSGLETELADLIIRTADLAGALKLDLSGAIVEKLAYNRNRADHKLENRLKSNGKKF